MNSHILITPLLEEGIARIRESLEGLEVKVFLRSEFKIDDAKDVAKEAYITSQNGKAIILAAQNYNIPTQNALLKLLEEPPPNTRLYIITPSKSALLPTVRSRLPLVKERVQNVVTPFRYDIKRMELKDIFEFAKESRSFGKEESIKTIESIFEATVNARVPLREGELQIFSNACRLIYLNERAENVFIYLLMNILRRQKIALKTAKSR